MGYTTRFTLTQVSNLLYGEKYDEAVEILKNDSDAHEFISTMKEEGLIDGKWYEYNDYMEQFSKIIPETLLKLHGEGEDSSDIWEKYYLRGKEVYSAEAKIVILTPNIEKLYKDT